MEKSADVIVAGAGPVGLLLSCELALAGVSVLVLEKESSTDSPWRTGPLSLRGVNTPSVEALYRRNLLGDVFGGDGKPKYFAKTTGPQFAGHFAGIMLDGNKVDFSQWKQHLPRPMQPGPTSLGQLEAVLSKRAQSLGVRILRGMAIENMNDEDESVKVQAGGQEFASEYLVGCDGGRSVVRKMAGFDFIGTEPEFTGYVTQSEVDRPELLKPGFQHTGKGMYISAGQGKLFACDFDLSFDRSQTITREHFQNVLRRVSGTDINVTALHLASSWTDRAMQVTQYRKGRIFLAGDSAHIHSPVGAQGLNLGIGDAMNLGWKLAATIKGHAAPGLLDTYHQERHPVGAQVLDRTRAQTAVLRPDTHSNAAYEVLRSVINTPGGADHFIDRFWGLSSRYDLGGDHSLVGCSVPDFELNDGQRIGTHMHSGDFVFVDFENDQSTADFIKSLEPLVAYHRSHNNGDLGVKAVLARPDGVVAWVAPNTVDIESLKASLARWLRLSIST